MTSPEPSDPPTPPGPRALLRLLARPLLALARALAALAAWPWRHRPPAARGLACGFAGLVLALGLLGTLFPLVLRSLLPSALDWDGAGALLARDGRPGDVVVVSPPWAERIRLEAPAALPALSQPRYAGEALAGVRRVWLVSLPDAPGFSWDPELDLLERAARSAPPLQLGALQLTRYDLSFPERPLAFLPDRLAGAVVTTGGEPCPADAAGRFRCGAAPGQGPGWSVWRAMREVEGVPRPCLVVEGPGAGEVTVELPDVPVGKVLRGHAGPLGPAWSAGGTTRLELLADGEALGAAELQPDGWRTFRLDTSRFADGTHRLQLRLSPAQPLCVEAVTLP
ncbi:MAG: hypothetical protein QM767_12590 [Anaeromyxobacter sp.]